MKQYLDIMRHVHDFGAPKSDRTGTGTRSVFGHQMRFNLADGFPLLTTKKMFINGMIDELLWFISGSTNCKDLPMRSQHWWTPWAKADGSLGPIYGEQYTKARWFFFTERKIFTQEPFEYGQGDVFGVGTLGDSRRKTGYGDKPAKEDHHDMLRAIWRDMMRRCYYKEAKSYANYGAKGVHVCKEWLDYTNFARDVQRLQGWGLKKHFPDEYSLDKDILFASNRYGPDTCIWASKTEQSYNTTQNTPIKCLNPDGKEVIFASIGEARDAFGLNVSAVHRCLNGELKKHHGWSGFEYLDKHENGLVMRFREVNQIHVLIASLRDNPDSRRHLINLWNTPAMAHAELPCCHGSIIQFYVANGRLSCQMYQRSADIFVGVPVNIASYALLTHMLAQQCGLGVGEFIWTGGDCHLYANHLEQAKKQLLRVTMKLPTLNIKRKPESIFDYKPDDFELVDYVHHPHIAAPVAV